MNVILQERFQSKLRQALTVNGWTQADLARRMGASPQFVGQYASGVRCPGLDVVERFATALGLPDPGLLIDESEITAEITQAIA